MPAPNERFGVIGGVCPPESLWDFASFAPRTSVSEPPTTQSRRHVRRQQATARWSSDAKTETKQLSINNIIY